MVRRAVIALLLVLAAVPAAVAQDAPVTQLPPPLLETDFEVPLQLVAQGVTDAQQALAAQAKARRRAEAERLEGTRTVRGALRRALMLDAIDQAHHDRWRRAWFRAQQRTAELPGRRRAELAGALRQVADLAQRRRLTPTRLPMAFLVVERNARFWSTRPLPTAAQRVSFGPDPVVFEARPGQGLVVHPLATWGRVNGVARACLAKPSRCPQAKLKADLDRLVHLAAQRGDFVAWEYLHRYGRGAGPWISGMAQGTAVQALARGAAALDEPRYRTTAKRALGAFDHATPLGVAVPGPGGGTHYAMYSFDPGLRILNGFLQTITGLRDAGVLLGNARATRLYRRGERAARAEVRQADTGAWSLYSERGRETSLHYHRLTTGFLRNLCQKTGRGAYCAAETRFARYEREPPRIALAAHPRTARPRRATTIVVRLNKVATVDVRVGGHALLTGATLPRGRHVLRWTPARPGRYALTVAATGLSGPRGQARLTVRVKAPPKPKAKPTKPRPTKQQPTKRR